MSTSATHRVSPGSMTIAASHSARRLVVGAALALASVTTAHAQFVAPWEDGCIESPEDGIFCDGGGISFSGPLTDVTVGSNTSVVWNAAYLSASNYRYSIHSGVTLSVTGDPDAPAGFSGTTNGGGTLRFEGGQLRLNYDNSHYGGTEIVGGRLIAPTRWALGYGPLKLAGGTLVLESTVNDISGLQLTGNGVLEVHGYGLPTQTPVTGSGTLIKSGPGMLVLNSVNTYTGGTRLQAGNLELHTDASLGQAGTSLALENNTGVWLANNFASSNRALTLSGTTVYLGVINGTATWNGAIGGTAGITKTGPGTLALAGANTYAGGTHVTAGAVSVAADSGLGSAGSGVTLDNGTTLQFSAGFTSSARPLTLATGTGNLEVASATSVIWTGDVSGPGSLEKTGSGTLVLSGTGTYTGGTTVSAGTLRLSAAGAVPAGPLTVHSTFDLGGLDHTATSLAGTGDILLGTGTFTASLAADTTFSGTFSGPGFLVKAGSATLTLPGVNTHTGGTILAGGRLTPASDAALGASSAPLTLAGGTLAVTDGFSSSRPVRLTGASSLETTGSAALAGPLSGSSPLAKTGAGTLTLAAANPFSGTLTVAAGGLRIGHTDALANATVALDAATSLGFGTPVAASVGSLGGTGSVLLTNQNAQAVTLTLGADNSGSTYAGALSGAGSLVKAGSGTLTLSGANTQLGGTTLGGGNLAIAQDSALGSASAAFRFEGGTLALGDGFTSARGFVFTGAALIESAGSASLAGTLSGHAAFTKTGVGALTLSGGANTFDGTVTVSAGSLVLGHSQALAAATFDTGSAGALSFGTLSAASLGGLSGPGSLALVNASAQPVALTLGANHADLAFAGTFTGGGSLVKAGDGVLTLSGANTFAGGTTVSAGTLRLGADQAAGPGTVSLGGTLDLNGHAQTVAGLTGSGTVLFGGGALTVDSATDSVFSGALSGSGSFVKAGSNLLTLSGPAGFTGIVSANAGTLRLGHSQSLANAIFQANGGTLSFGNLNAATLGGLAGSGALVLKNDANQPLALTVGDLSTGAFSGALSGSGSFAKTGSGFLTLSGPATHTGTTTLRGNLRMGAAGALSAASTVFLNDGATLDLAGHDQTVGDLDSYDVLTGMNDAGTVLLSGATLTNLTRTTNNWTGSLTGAGTFVKKGAATMNWHAANLFTGTLKIEAGTISAEAADVLSPNAAVQLATGTALALNNHNQTIAGLSGTGSVYLGSAALTLNQSADTTFSGALSGTGSVIKSGSGALTLSGTNSHSGGTTLSGGSLVIASDSALGQASGPLHFDGGALRTTSSLTVSRATTLGASGSGLDVADGTALTWTGAISGTGPLAKQGPGELTLSGTNTYAGGTVVHSGTLSIAADSALGATGSALTLKDGTTLRVGPGFASSRPLSITGTAVTLAPADSVAWSGVVSGSAQFVKTGAGLLTLSGANTFSGGLNISAGSVSVANDSALGAAAGPLRLGDATTLRLTGGFTSSRAVQLAGDSATFEVTGTPVTWNGAISGSATFRKTGTGTLTLSGANQLNGATLVSAGTLRAGVAGALSTGPAQVDSVLEFGDFNHTLTGLSGAGSVVLGTGRLTLDLAADSSFTGVFSGAGSLTKTGAGSLALSSANTHSGGVTLAGGRLAIAADSALGGASAPFTVQGGTLAVSGTVSSTRPISLAGPGAFEVAQSLSLGGVISGSGSLTKTGAGTLTLSGANTFTGGLTLNGGTLVASTPSALGASGGSLTIASGTLDLPAGNSYGNSVFLSGPAGIRSSGDFTLSGAIGGTGSLTKTGAGVLTLSSANTFTGTTTIASGGLLLGHSLALGGSSFNSDSFGLSFGGLTNVTFGGLYGSGDLLLKNAGNQAVALTVGANHADSTYSGQLSGAGSLVKTGAGVLTLAAEQTYTGATVINNGTLRLGAIDQLVSSSIVRLAGNGVLDLAGHEQIVENLESQSGGTIRLGGAQLINRGSSDTQWAGALVGEGEFWKQGDGIMAWTGANTFSGVLRVQVGYLNASAAGTLSPNAVVAVNSFAQLVISTPQTIAGLQGTGFVSLVKDLTINQADDRTFGGNIFGPGALIKSGAGDLAFTLSFNSHAGGTVITGGSLTVNADRGLGVDHAPLTLNGGRLVINGEGASVAFQSVRPTYLGADGGAIRILGNQPGPVQWNGVIEGPGSLIKSGGGTLVLNAANSFAGTTTIAEGSLLLGHASALAGSTLNTDGAGSLLIGNVATINLGGLSGAGSFNLVNGSASPLALSVGANGSDTTYSGIFSGTGSFTKTGAGTFTLSGAATHTGATSIRGGILKTSAANVLSPSSALFLNNDATLDLAGHDQTVGDFDSYNSAAARFDASTVLLGGATITNKNRVTNNWHGALTGNGSFVKQGAATMNWYGTNTFTGTLKIDAGKLSAQAVDTLSPNAAVQVGAGATLDLNNRAQTVAGLSGAGNVALGSAALTLAQAADTTFSGVISGTGSVAKSGAGSLTLSGASSYSGGTTVQAGTLRAGHVNAFGTGGVEITGGSVDFAGFAIANNIINHGGTLTGLTNYAGTQTIAGSVSFSGAVGGAVNVGATGSLNTTGATFTGPVTVQSGGSLGGTGTLGTLTVAAGGTLSPGNSPGLLTIGDGSILSGTTLIELGGLGRGTGYDAIDVFSSGGGLGSLTVGGTLDVVFYGGWTPSGAASFQVFQATSFGGSFAQVNLPALGAGYVWSTDRLLNTGYLDLVASAIPEPSTYAAAAALVALFCAARHRKRRKSAHPSGA